MTQITPMQERILRTEQMLNAGITHVHNYGNNYLIQSQRINKKYETTLNSCTCPDNQKGYVCKHILLLKKHVVEQTPKHTNKCPKCDSLGIKKHG